MKATYFKHTLEFKRPAGTSRGTLHTKDAWYLILEHNGVKAIGECSLLPGLSADDRPDFEQKLQDVCNSLNKGEEPKNLHAELAAWPSIRFGLEQAVFMLKAKGSFKLFDSSFSAGQKGISINGLIWMGDSDFLNQQVEDLLKEGYNCLKIKIGAIDLKEEMALLKRLRKQFDPDELIMRVDANGAFTPGQAVDVLDDLADLEIHSIEQPIKPGNPTDMATLCEESLVPIALDEELIGVWDPAAKKKLLNKILPDYIVLKPGLLGGIKATAEWIEAANALGIGWWVTSSLESNIGLNAIAQWVATLNPRLHQGLGTGNLYKNNIPSPLEAKGGKLWYKEEHPWDLSLIKGF